MKLCFIRFLRGFDLCWFAVCIHSTDARVCRNKGKKRGRGDGYQNRCSDTKKVIMVFVFSE
ncbi:hypothetical protein Hanom_Chr03g00227281 [Helianthus anomalus]